MKKLFTSLLLIALVCTMLVGCGINDEDAIKQVVCDFYQAGFNWDFQTMKDCVAPEVPIYDSYETSKNTYLQKAANGFMVEADIDKFMALDRELDKKLGEAIEYRNWNVSISGNTATVMLTVAGAGVDFDKILTEDGKFAYRDGLFTQVCGMDETTAKENLSPEEFSAVHLQVQDLEYQLWLENLSQAEKTAEIQLRKEGGRWMISNILPAE